MSISVDRSTVRNPGGNRAIVDAARVVIAGRGLAGMSLRTVAEEAGTSVGSISYRIGDRAALVAAVVDREIGMMARTREEWRARVGGMDSVRAGSLPDLIGEWLDSGARERRVSAIVTCELVLAGSRNPRKLPGLEALLDAGEALWRDVLAQSPDGARLARRIASYCLDEQPFSISLSDLSDYRLLRHSTIRALLKDTDAIPPPGRSAWHMALVERLAVPAADALGKAAEPPRGTKATIARHIADVIIAEGVGALSHRLVAQASHIALSSIAYHYPTQRDILFAGVEEIYRRLRASLRASGESSNDQLIHLTHESALMARIDPAFRPFAIDMRRRRAENVHLRIAEWLGIAAESDRALTQAAVMAFIGHLLRATATGAPPVTTGHLVDGMFGKPNDRIESINFERE